MQASRSNFFSVRLENVVSINPSVKTRSSTKLSFRFSGTLVNSDSMSKETKRKPSSNKFCGIAFMAETALKELVRWYSLIVGISFYAPEVIEFRPSTRYAQNP